jgi:hypothetical protein
MARFAGRAAVSRWALHGALLAGLAASFPGLVPAVGAGNWPRSTDLLNFACAVILAMQFMQPGKLHRSFRVLLLVWAMTVPWVFLEILALGGSHDAPVQRLLIRWCACGCSAYVVTVMMEHHGLRGNFIAGLLLGVALSAATVLYDFLTFTPGDLPLEELVNLAIYNGKDLEDFVYRASGIFGHPNGAAGCVLLGVPVLIGAIEEGRWPRWSIVLAILLIGGIFYLTKTRGPLAISAALVLCWGWYQTRGKRLPLLLVAACLGLAVMAAGGLTGQFDNNILLDRFLDSDSISVNADDRWWTISTSLDFILRHPFGMGSSYVVPLEIATNTSATHNAYLELALMGGVPLTIFVVVRLVMVASLLFTARRPMEAWIAVYLLGIFAFESYFLQINIQLMTLWLVVSPVASWKAAARPAQVLSRTRSGLPAGFDRAGRLHR